MTRHEDLLERLERANPVPDLDQLYPDPVESRRFSTLVEQRRERMDDTKVRPIRSTVEPPRSKRGLLAAAAAFVIVVGIGIGIVLLIGSDSGGDIAEDPTPIVPETTEAAPPTTEPQALATSLAEAGLPTEWRLGISTEVTELEEGVRVDNSYRLSSEQFSAEGTASLIEKRVRNVAVECMGERYDNEFVWTAMSRGTGELDFGDSGSMTLEFNAVSVASTETGMGTVCAEVNGTYTGASGDLANATGTFTYGYPPGNTWTFDSEPGLLGQWSP